MRLKNIYIVENIDIFLNFDIISLSETTRPGAFW